MKAVREMTSEELAGLNKKPFIKIQWRQRDRAKLQVVFEDFPKAIAMAFSPLITDHLTNKFPKGRTFIAECGSPQLSRAIFDWMLVCCQERAIVYFPTPGNNSFNNYTHIYIAADRLQIVCLKNDIFTRINNLANTDFQYASDINFLYDSFPKGHALRFVASKGAAKCFFMGKFGKVGKTSDEYYDEIVEDFEDDVKKHFKHKLTENDQKWAERQKLTNSEGMKQYMRLEDMPER